MPLIIPGNVASATASTGYEVANSCRFNDGDTAYLHKATAAGDRQKWTYSVWIKRCTLGTNQTWTPVQADSANANAMSGYFETDDQFNLYDYNAPGVSAQIITNRKFRDIGAWYHFVIAVDTTQGTANNRLRFYVNGVEERGVGGYGTDTMPAEDYEFNLNQDTEELYIGANYTSSVSTPSDMYMAEACFIDGTQYAASDFGEFDEDSPTIWKPKDVSGLTFGDEGFYCDMEASDNLGNDANGGTDLTESNLAAADQATDTPTNNFCTGNPLANFYNQTTFSEGNCKATLASSPYGYDIGTMGVANGKWYWEIKYTSGSGDPHNVGGFGISGKGESLTASAWLGYQSGSSSTDYGYMDEGGTGVLYTNVSGADTDASRSFAIGNIIGIAIDLDSGTHTMTLYVNGNATTTDNISSSPTSGFYFPAWSYGYSAGGAVFELNFGGCPAYAITSGNADANGYGNFEYAVPSGYYALCTKNLAEFG